MRRDSAVAHNADSDGYRGFFRAVTGFSPYPYQERIGEGAFPQVLDVPTGMGKTAAVVVAWLRRRLASPAQTPRRLIYCLPMRVLVEQTRRAVATWIENVRTLFEKRGLKTPRVAVLMGGEQQLHWVERPEEPAVIVGTQDMLLSRALMRGYGMSRYGWPIPYALLHNDAFWVFDEVQLMGPAVETGAQLQAFRDAFGTAAPGRSLWMSATVGESQLDTVDHPRPAGGWDRHGIGTADRAGTEARKRIEARKAVRPLAAVVPNSTAKGRIGSYAAEVAGAATQAHVAGELTLVIANTVGRAQAIYRALEQAAGADAPEVSLIHSRFRPHERRGLEKALEGDGGRIVVATQVVEAGVDVSARVLVTEPAPWPSIVQRAGRCNRYGEFNDTGGGRMLWIDAEEGEKAAAPYDEDALHTARGMLEGLEDASPEALGRIEWEPPVEIRPVLRRKDLLELFDTTPDLSGRDIDVAPYIRDADDTDAFVYWRRWEGHAPPEEAGEPDPEELCRVPVWSADGLDDFLNKDNVVGWRWRPLEGRWERVSAQGRVRPGQTVLLDVEMGGYDEAVGWTGNRRDEPAPIGGAAEDGRSMDDDVESDVGSWIDLPTHLRHVTDAAMELAEALDLPPEDRQVVVEAARWHDVGKAHEQFQNRLLGPLEEDEDLPGPAGEGPWAKSNHRRGRYERPHFRHELASALAYLDASADGKKQNKVAHVVAAHHGKIRLSIRSLPREKEPEEPGRLFARGVWDGEELGAVELPREGERGPFTMDLGLMQLGEGSWMERMLTLRDDGEIGPFRLAWLEALLRIADRRASGRERETRGDG
jgi:CRISPR-associated endonuclease/helicase Cas3